MFMLSLLLHGVLFFALFWVPGSGSGLKMNEAVEVTIADASKISQAGGKPASQKNTARTSPADNRQARRISPSSSKKNAVTVAKRTVERSRSKPKNDQVSSDQLLNKAISKIEKKVTAEKNDDYYDKAIAALEKKTGSTGGRKTGGGALGSLAMNVYKMQVETYIKEQWSYPDALGSNYEAVVLLKIMKDGTVLKTDFVKPSRNKLFDESVLKAIEKAGSLPPLPEGYNENYEEIEIRFNLDLE